jgi:hypothetical protein
MDRAMKRCAQPSMNDHITMIIAAKIEHTIMNAPTIFQVPSS